MSDYEVYLSVALLILWVFGGMYCMVVDILTDRDFRVDDIMVVIFSGSIIGIMLGICHVLSFLHGTLMGLLPRRISYNTTLICQQKDNHKLRLI